MEENHESMQFTRCDGRSSMGGRWAPGPGSVSLGAFSAGGAVSLGHRLAVRVRLLPTTRRSPATRSRRTSKAPTRARKGPATSSSWTTPETEAAYRGTPSRRRSIRSELRQPAAEPRASRLRKALLPDRRRAFFVPSSRTAKATPVLWRRMLRTRRRTVALELGRLANRRDRLGREDGQPMQGAPPDSRPF